MSAVRLRGSWAPKCAAKQRDGLAEANVPERPLHRHSETLLKWALARIARIEGGAGARIEGSLRHHGRAQERAGTIGTLELMSHVVHSEA